MPPPARRCVAPARRGGRGGAGRTAEEPPERPSPMPGRALTGCYHRQMRRPWRIAAATLFTITVLAGALFGDRLLALSESARQGLSQYTELVEAVHAHYGTEVTYKDVVYSSINGMLRKLDPHTSFLPPEAYAKMRDRQQASFYGLGILVGERDNKLTVISPVEGTPASRMGIRAGDIISEIEGV